MRLLYVLASYLLFWVLCPVLLLHRKTRPGLLQRLGYYPAGLFEFPNGPRIWFHGASAGDLLALSPIFQELKRRLPDCRILLTTTTNTGYLMATERLASQVDRVVYAPYDLWGATRRAVKALRPELLVLEYTEIWPNLIHAVKATGAGIALTNGRFSPKHLGQYRWLFSLVGNPLQHLDLLLMREEDEAERARGLGAPPERVFVTGNTKFDALVPTQAGEDAALREALGLPGEEEGVPVWLAGSTHEGEEAALLEVFRRLLERFPTLRMVIAPRYIDRSGRVVGLAQAAGFEVGRRSVAGEAGRRVMVLDTIGELARAYRLATLVFVGGSFIPRGGQNILEPAAQGKPVLFGPHMENFQDSVRVLLGRGGLQAKDPEHLHQVLAELLSKPGAVAHLGGLAQASVRQVSGASVRNVDHLERWLQSSARGSAQRPAQGLVQGPTQGPTKVDAQVDTREAG